MEGICCDESFSSSGIIRRDCGLECGVPEAGCPEAWEEYVKELRAGVA